MRLPKGYPSPYQHGHTRISVTLKNATFKRLLERAKKEGISFSATVEDTLKCGFLCIEESDNHEVEHNERRNGGNAATSSSSA